MVVADHEDSWKDAWETALQEWREARAAFDEAQDPFIDFQALRLRAAEEKLSLLLRLMREHPEIAPKSLKARPRHTSADE
ncbi:MAG: hypothetical protein M1516_03305 [Firmicutes bacterium]|jgi:hypothetical protein|nr:hypothetical protein [Bacillota bacterium]